MEADKVALKVFLALFLAFVIGGVLAAVTVWPTMLMFGVVHSYWAWLPAFGFWQTFGVLVLVRLLMPVQVNTK
jgi:hypothetical protein